ncbi:MAG: hypothetical protein KVP17_000416 [Porospora cf. gigantea B]|uniref:uncharacterized protein n=1 Tax=Porospora cf. gigantea B TaxID=2853592 RepID=UPI003571CA30|nr:MAG: hypothetical protein KVP17_000416 [Porospora cf. gigantea B]
MQNPLTILNNPVDDDDDVGLERCLLAAMEVRDLEKADTCIRKLRGLFPVSTKLDILDARYQGMLKGDEFAEAALLEVLKKDPTNVAARKALLGLSLHSPAKKVELLRSHLDDFPSDEESWRELAHTLSGLGAYEDAVFCLEEGLLLKPTNTYVMLTLGELLLSLDRVEDARKYFARVLQIDNNCSRAWWYLLFTSKHHSVTDRKRQFELPELTKHAKARLAPKDLSQPLSRAVAAVLSEF